MGKKKQEAEVVAAPIENSEKKPTLMEYKEKLTKLKSEFMEASKVAMREAFQGIFDNFSWIKSFSFTAYTPYFNDGDICEFSVHSDYPNINKSDGEIDYIDANALNECRKEWDIPTTVTLDELKRARKVISETLSTFDDDVFKDTYGDHAEVTILRSGKVKVKEYSHD